MKAGREFELKRFCACVVGQDWFFSCNYLLCNSLTCFWSNVNFFVVFLFFIFFFCKIVVFLQGNVRVLLFNYITALFLRIYK